VLEIPRQLLADMIRADGNLALAMLGSISARQRLLVQQIEQVTARNAAQRIGSFLLRLCSGEPGNKATVSLPYDKSLVAKRLNIQPETFSRALGRLKSRGVGVKKRVITIADREALARYCEYDERDRPC
jgi:CRP-like cAMP-binding protein